MEYTNLGRSGLVVFRIVLGTMNFGPKTSEEDSFAIMDSAHERGVNFFDTANVRSRRGRPILVDHVARSSHPAASRIVPVNAGSLDSGTLGVSEFPRRIGSDE